MSECNLLWNIIHLLLYVHNLQNSSCIYDWNTNVLPSLFGWNNTPLVAVWLGLVGGSVSVRVMLYVVTVIIAIIWESISFTDLLYDSVELLESQLSLDSLGVKMMRLLQNNEVLLIIKFRKIIYMKVFSNVLDHPCWVYQSGGVDISWHYWVYNVLRTYCMLFKNTQLKIMFFLISHNQVAILQWRTCLI